MKRFAIFFYALFREKGRKIPPEAVLSEKVLANRRVLLYHIHIIGIA